ncbi:MAG: thymidine kinase [Fluviicola sp.]|nr:thymidine kinase [Fluviicola sp.]PHQ99966.1 MAG: thymidine kinase [Marinosulfonomonas sp.]
MFLEHFPDDNKQHGWVEVVCGSMFSGKTEELIRRLKRAEFANQKILLVKPAIDDRYHKENVVSHQGTSFTALAVKDSQAVLDIWKKEKVVAIDEAQFFDAGIVDVCNSLAEKGVRVIVAGLDMDFQGVPFGPMPQLLSIAEYVTKVHAICLSCGSLAQFSHRTGDAKEQVMVGAVEEYKPLCRSCFNKIAH